MYFSTSVVLASLAALVSTSFTERGLPVDPTNVTVITSPGGVTLRYKEPGNDGICETTSGVKSYSGYVDLNSSTHVFFWFFEARKDPANAPITLWLNGGPGSDSMIGLFQELGPCNITADLKSSLNPFAWNEVSNMLFISQPIGTGFSYSNEVIGSPNGHDFTAPNSTDDPTAGRYASSDPFAIDTTELAAAATWHVMQAFMDNLSQLDPTIKSKTFNLWTESYGGHYGPVFFDYFSNQNAAIANGSMNGTVLIMDTLGIGNGIVDELIQAPYYPEFAANNTYGIKAISDSVYQEMKSAYFDHGMCKDQILACSTADLASDDGQVVCSKASDTCRTFVESPYYRESERGVYDIRHDRKDLTPPTSFIQYLNLASTQQAIGVKFNYTYESSTAVSEAFRTTGDYVYPVFKSDLEYLLNNSIRVNLYYGDADYICNWFGGEALSLLLDYTHAPQFRSAGYTPFTVKGTEYGAVRQAGNLSFVRIYDAGHEVPYYQPEASLEMFRRVLNGQVVSDGAIALTPDYATNGTVQATHTEAFVPVGTDAVARTGGAQPLVTDVSVGSSSSSSGTAPKPSASTSAGRRRISMFWRQ